MAIGVSVEVGASLVLRADTRQGRDTDLICTVQGVDGRRALVEVIVWGFVTRTRWVRLTELKEAEWT